MNSLNLVRSLHPELRPLKLAWRWPNGMAFRGRNGRISHAIVGSGRMFVPEGRDWRDVSVSPFRHGADILVPDIGLRIGPEGEMRAPKTYLPRGVGVVRDGNYRRLRKIGAPLLTPDILYRPVGPGMHFETRMATDGWSEHLILERFPEAEGDYLALEVAVKNKDGNCGKWLAWAEDATGRRMLCDLFKHAEGVLVAVPMDWLSKAVYPVDVDPDLTQSLICWCQGSDTSSYAAARSTCDSTLSSCGGGQRLGQLKAGASFYSVARHSWIFGALCLTGDVTDITMDLAVSSKAETLVDFDIEIADSDFRAVYLSSGTSHSAKCGVGCTVCEGVWDTCVAAATSVTWKNTSAVVIDTYYTSPSLDAAYAEQNLNDYEGLYYCCISAEDQSASAPTSEEAVNLYCPGNASFKPIVHLTGDFSDCSGMQAYVIPEFGNWET